MPRKIVACHQPNFLPWLGFFSKIAQSTHFIFLNDVQFSHGQHNWTTRVKILGSNGTFWLTVPISKSNLGFQKIMDLRTLNDSRWIEKTAKTLHASYAKAKFYEQIIPPIIQILKDHNNLICNTNINLIKHLSSTLSLNTEFILSSDLHSTKTSNERLVDLVSSINGNVYLCGNGADDYQNDEIFSSYGIRLEYSKFKQSEYEQSSKNGFYSGLSIIDALCNIGIEKTRDILINH